MNIDPYHITRDGKPCCGSVTVEEERFLYSCITSGPLRRCGYPTREEAEEAVQLYRKLIPGHTFEAVQGACPEPGLDD